MHFLISAWDIDQLTSLLQFQWRYLCMIEINKFKVVALLFTCCCQPCRWTSVTLYSKHMLRTYTSIHSTINSIGKQVNRMSYWWIYMCEKIVRLELKRTYQLNEEIEQKSIALYTKDWTVFPNQKCTLMCFIELVKGPLWMGEMIYILRICIISLWCQPIKQAIGRS